jgi:hypothetical protein
MNIFKSSSNIQMRIIRDSNEANDDRLVIKYKGEDTYQIYFRDGNSHTLTTYCTVLSGDELDVYLDSLFTLLARDKEPFQAIDFQIPCFPVLRYDIQDLGDEKLSSTLKTIMSVLYAAAPV